jgi:nucleotide-binding universal stress UspA family protein
MNPTKTGRVLACVDQSRFADFVADHAAWAAQRLDAPLEFLHVLDRHPEVAQEADHSGTIGLDTQEHLLSELSGADERRSREAREQGRVFLNRLRERAIAAGVAEPDVRQRHGELEATLVEQERSVRLFVFGRRGESAEATNRDIGRNVERVIRALRKPILAVTDGFRVPERVLVAFDGGALSRRGVELITTSPLFRGLTVHVIMSGAARADGSKQLAWARQTLETAGFDTTATMVPGDVERTVADAVKQHDIHLLVMGAYSHSPLRTLFLGSKTSDLLRSASIPALLIR